MNRRVFVKRAGAAILPVAILGPRLLSVSAAVGAIAADHPMISPITSVIYDERYSDCRVFAEALVRGGAVPFALNGNSAKSINGDSASLWYGALWTHPACHGGRVAGFTTYSDFGVSQSCGRELDLKMIYEGRHDCRASATVRHRLRSIPDAHEKTGACFEENASWPRALAHTLCRISPADSHSIGASNAFSNRTAAWAETIARTSRSSDHPGYLMSWLLAPGIRSGQSIQVGLRS